MFARCTAELPASGTQAAALVAVPTNYCMLVQGARNIKRYLYYRQAVAVVTLGRRFLRSERINVDDGGDAAKCPPC